MWETEAFQYAKLNADLQRQVSWMRRVYTYWTYTLKLLCTSDFFKNKNPLNSETPKKPGTERWAGIHLICKSRRAALVFAVQQKHACLLFNRLELSEMLRINCQATTVLKNVMFSWMLWREFLPLLQLLPALSRSKTHGLEARHSVPMCTAEQPSLQKASLPHVSLPLIPKAFINKMAPCLYQAHVP